MRTIRTLGLAEVETLLGWAAVEGWNPGLHDAPAFHAADPNGVFGAFVDDIMVAAIAAVAYDERFGFIGLYICHPDWRGQGHGKAVWDAGMAYLGNRTIGLDGVPEQQANYASMGFVPAYDTVRMSGTLVAEQSATVEPASSNAIAQVDARCFPAARSAFLAQWTSPPNRTFGLGTGYAVLRQCRENFKIGPLFAPDAATALELLKPIAGAVQIDVPAAQTAFLAALTAKGFAPSFATTRMYRGPAPGMDLASVFGVTSLELG